MRKTRYAEKFFMIALFIAAAAGAYYLITHPPKGNSVRPITDIEEEITVSASERKITDHTGKYTVDVTYPFLSVSSTSTAQNSINKHLKETAEKLVAEFRTGTEEGFSFEGQTSILSSEYKIYEAYKDHISIAISVVEYIAGAAHPNSYVLTMTYDLATGEEATLGSIVRVNKGGLETLSSVAITTLNEKLTGEGFWTKEGAGPKEENFEKFAVSSDGLIVYFNPYQIGPGALGIVTVTLPWSEISTIALGDFKL